MKLEEAPITKDLALAWPYLVRAINHVNLAQLDGKVISFTSAGVPGNESIIAHGLGRVPRGWIVLRIDRSANIYEFAPPDATNIYLAASTSNVNATIVVL